ncbi:hypothetical protein N781_10205 [Pontibacillus halophilus JSM 076056 = DSM 19796]|uniref:Uncharacterized protein n=1 Tax=Pontibacillus halophilus JSM 076056 = DSM 19796 TaxID=1385510 RepID=A0A0A5GNS2_9BACI|nr:hypothetical protein [Pontibacillus halophilus]KGX93614.1 hypothetical protein N781_10205 [Pontibacillus halophilus JSM 076056 = DSM 19796]
MLSLPIGISFTRFMIIVVLIGAQDVLSQSKRGALGAILPCGLILFFLYAWSHHFFGQGSLALNSLLFIMGEVFLIGMWVRRRE